MTPDYRAGMLRAADMCEVEAQAHRERKKAAASVHDKADEQAQEFSLTAMSLAILTALETDGEAAEVKND